MVAEGRFDYDHHFADILQKVTSTEFIEIAFGEPAYVTGIARTTAFTINVVSTPQGSN